MLFWIDLNDIPVKSVFPFHDSIHIRGEIGLECKLYWNFFNYWQTSVINSLLERFCCYRSIALYKNFLSKNSVLHRQLSRTKSGYPIQQVEKPGQLGRPWFGSSLAGGRLSFYLSDFFIKQSNGNSSTFPASNHGNSPINEEITI